MGAAAFLIAEFSRVPYIYVVAAAILPSILYVFAVYLTIHIEAIKANIGTYRGTDESLIVNIFKDYGHLLIPLIVLIVLLVQRRTAYNAATIAALSTVVVSWLRPTTRMGVQKLIRAVQIGIQRIIPIAATLLCAGIGVAALQTTGTPYRLTAMIVSLSGGSLFITLILIAGVVIILGMGLPITGAFLIASLFGASALVEFGVDPFIAYMFIFMFALTAPITPPVCLSSFAAASIAETSFTKTGWRGFLLGLPAFIIPFMVVYNPVLLFPFQKGFVFGIQSIFTAFIGVTALVGSLEGWLMSKANIIQRCLLLVAAFGLMYPETVSDLIGLAIVVAITVWQWVGIKLTNKKGGAVCS